MDEISFRDTNQLAELGVAVVAGRAEGVGVELGVEGVLCRQLGQLLLAAARPRLLGQVAHVGPDERPDCAME